MKFGSLFAGIGGIDLGLERAGMECIWQVENDDYCNRVLEKHWPDVQRFGDVRECTDLPPVDLIAGGFPCQPHSVAGKRKGAEDDRNLWPEFIRIIRETRPRYVIAENVPGIITTYIDTVLSDLEGEGYTCSTFNLPALAFDAPHRRERIFIVAHNDRRARRFTDKQTRPGLSDSSRDGSKESVADAKKGQDHQRKSRDMVEATEGGEGSDSASWDGGQDLADRELPRLEGHAGDGTGGNKPGREQEEADGSVSSSGLRKDMADASSESLEHNSQDKARGKQSGRNTLGGSGTRERTDSSPPGWIPEPNVGRVAHGIPSRVDRLRGLGNAVVPQVAQWIGERILEFDE